MNKFQLTVLIAALANLALMLIFPPFNSQSLFRAGPASFDAFYLVSDAPANAALNSGLLYLEVFFVLVNAVLAWVLLQGAPQQPSRPRVRWQNVLQWLIIANLLLILLFPPFETQPERVFEGFRFALGGNVQRGIFLPFLFLELFLLALDAAALWLAFGLGRARIDRRIGRSARSGQKPDWTQRSRPAAGSGSALRRSRAAQGHRAPQIILTYLPGAGA